AVLGARARLNRRLAAATGQQRSPSKKPGGLLKIAIFAMKGAARIIPYCYGQALISITSQGRPADGTVAEQHRTVRTRGAGLSAPALRLQHPRRPLHDHPDP